MVIYESDPADRVAAVYRRIRIDRMNDVPLPPLEVEAVGFRRWNGHWLGVLITPWAMSLMLLPGQAEGWEQPPDNIKKAIAFPSGDYVFLGGSEEGLGEYQSCALISPMGQFPDQETARLTALAALTALLQAPPVPEQPASPSRRGFLTGRVDKAVDNA